MVDIGRALIGGIAGAAGASKEIFEDRMQAANIEKKQKALEKRQQTLAKFSHGLAMQRDVAQAGRAEEREERALAGRKEIAQMQIEGQKDIAQMRTDRQAKKLARTKPATPEEQRFMRTNAINDIRAAADTLGGLYLEDANVVEIPITPENRMRIQRIKSLVQQKGFNPQFSEDENFLTISLGGFDYRKLGQPAASAAPRRKPSNAFDELREALQLQTGRSRMNTQGTTPTQHPVPTRPDKFQLRRSNPQTY